MGTICFACGCYITTSMFGTRDVVHAVACLEHSSQVSKELNALANKIRSLQKTNLQDGTKS